MSNLNNIINNNIINNIITKSEINYQCNNNIPSNNQNSSVKNYCQNLKNNETFFDLLNNHYKKRNQAIINLNNLNRCNNKIYMYPNLDFISNFGNFMYVGDEYSSNDCICNLVLENNKKIANQNPLKLDKVFGKGKIGTVYSILYKRENLIIKTISNVQKKNYLSLVLHHRNSVNRSHFQYQPSISYNEQRTINLKKKHNDLHIFSVEIDEFSNQTCIHMILNQILKKKIPNYVYQYDAFYCKNKENKYDGFNIMEIASKGDVTSYLEELYLKNGNMDDKFILDMYKQILTPLSILKSKKFGFCHNDMKCKNVFVAEKEGKIIYKLADFDKSSIFWKGIRFCNTIRTVNKQLQYILNTKYQGYPVTKSTIDNNFVYKLIKDPFIKKINNIYIMYSWIPMHMSYDIYTFTISLLNEPIFWEKFSQDLFIKSNITRGANYKYHQFLNILETLFDQIDLSNLLNYINNIMIKFINNMKKFTGNNNLNLSQAIKLLYTSKKDTIINYKKTFLKEQRAISSIGIFMANLELKLKVNIDNVYTKLGLMSPSKIDSIIDDYEKNKIKKSFIISDDNHICTNECTNNKCSTNTYSKFSLRGTQILHEDKC